MPEKEDTAEQSLRVELDCPPQFEAVGLAVRIGATIRLYLAQAWT
ncbi:MAG: hypothetical protein WDM85_04600 [Caulobacteraceae bacterium]